MKQPETVTTVSGVMGGSSSNGSGANGSTNGSTSGWINIYPDGLNIELGEHEMEHVASSKWEFNALHESLIEFDDIGNELDGENPMAVVTHGNTERYVVVSNWLLLKREVLGIDALATEKHIEGMKFVVYKIEGNFKEWIKWAKDIKKASWPPTRREHNTVEVALPKI